MDAGAELGWIGQVGGWAGMVALTALLFTGLSTSFLYTRRQHDSIVSIYKAEAEKKDKIIAEQAAQIKALLEGSYAAKDFFDSLESRADPSKLAGMSNSYLFDIEDEGQWLVTVADGQLSVAQGGGEADATITASGETFDKIVAGEQNPTTAYMTGKLKIKGDLGAAMKLQKLF